MNRLSVLYRFLPITAINITLNEILITMHPANFWSYDYCCCRHRHLSRRNSIVYRIYKSFFSIKPILSTVDLKCSFAISQYRSNVISNVDLIFLKHLLRLLKHTHSIPYLTTYTFDSSSHFNFGHNNSICLPMWLTAVRRKRKKAPTNVSH